MITSPRLDDLIARLPSLRACAVDIAQGFELMQKSLRDGGKLLLCGNGGSAADAEHWAGELLKGFEHPRRLSDEAAKDLPENLRNGLQWAIPAIPLTGFVALSTAFANDLNHELIFAQLVWGLGKSGDVLVALSTSGNSPNICHAARAARVRGLRVLALTGQSGGALRELADVCICVPASFTPLVQEYHLPVYHCLSLMLEDAWAEIHG